MSADERTKTESKQIKIQVYITNETLNTCRTSIDGKTQNDKVCQLNYGKIIQNMEFYNLKRHDNQHK